jgi:hypothetical protein
MALLSFFVLTIFHSASCLSTLGQGFSLESFTIGGGGGASTGGEFSMTGSVGEPATGPLSGGDFTVEGGFWAVVSQVTVPDLTVRLLSNGTVQICWPSSGAQFTLQETITLSRPAWSASAVVPADDTGMKCVTVPATRESHFFRLAR